MESQIATDARELILSHVDEQLAAKGLTPSDVPPSFDLLLEGVIDSFGIVELLLMLEQTFDFKFDFDELDVDDLTRVGPLAEHVARKAGAQ